VGTNALRDNAYFQASKALERAVAADDAYALAHARLAEALVELDYVDKAKDELLRVSTIDRSAVSKIDLLYLDAITATARRDFAKSIELYNRIAQQVTDAEKAYALVDLGRAYKNNNDIKMAIQSFTDATNRNPQYATAYLHLGILYGRQQELATALASFDKAESVYQALGNLEGRTEVVFERGALFNKLNRLSDAKAQLEQALALAKANDNQSQAIKTLLQLSSVAADSGETTRATEYAREAVDLAQKNGMENLTARGLTDLGNAFLVRGEYIEAERYLSQALESAQRAKALRNEARVRVSLANLRLQQNDAEEAVRYLDPALAFYEQGGFGAETSSCLALLARAKLQKGDYEAALKADQQLLEMANEWKDQKQIALSHSEIGSVLARQEKYSEALDHFNEAYVIYQSQGVQRSLGYNLQSRGNALWQLGRYREAQSLLDEASTIADKPGGELKSLSFNIKLVVAEMALSQSRFPSVKSTAENVLATVGTQSPNVALSAKVVIGLAQSYSGAAIAGKQTIAEAVVTARRLGDPAQLASTQLALAEAQLFTGDAQGALSATLEALEVFTRLGQQASEWRALLVAGLASRSLGDKSKAREYALRARDSLAKLEQRWGSENYNSYLSRPDIQRFRQKLSELTGSALAG
jgi:tetratricopeptide (TPR) repeat protein